MKERLIGAAVLVAVAVWVIPWILDGPPEPPEADGLALQLPAPEETAPMRSQTLRLTQEPDPAGEPAARPPARSPAAPPVVEPARVAAAPVDSRSERPAEPPNAVPQAAAETPAAASRSAPAAAGDWVVQLGSFGDAANAERLAGRVGTYGYDARVSDYRAGGRTMHRVRVGPHPTRDQAESVASSLSAHGFVAQVVTVD